MEGGHDGGCSYTKLSYASVEIMHRQRLLLAGTLTNCEILMTSWAVKVQHMCVHVCVYVCVCECVSVTACVHVCAGVRAHLWAQQTLHK
jgi:hypothetical protein